MWLSPMALSIRITGQYLLVRGWYELLAQFAPRIVHLNYYQD